MIVIGLTGSIAMGKSEVASVFREQGLPVFDADKEVHRLYDSPEGAQLLKPLAPAAIVEGRVDRKELSAVVMADAALLEKLETIVHAEITARRRDFLRDASARGQSMAVVDVPLLFEKGGDKDVDVTVVVSSPETEQKKRALSRPGMTPEKLAMVLKRQMSDTEKRRRADFVIENNSTLEELKNRTLSVLKAIRKEHAL
jgi:dephospho-CoA kinase